jgi:hypothetical protein
MAIDSKSASYSELFDYLYGSAHSDACKEHFDPVTLSTWNIIQDLMDRRGIHQAIDACDDEIKDEIFESMRDQVQQAVNNRLLLDLAD